MRLSDSGFVVRRSASASTVMSSDCAAPSTKRCTAATSVSHNAPASMPARNAASRRSLPNGMVVDVECLGDAVGVRHQRVARAAAGHARSGSARRRRRPAAGRSARPGTAHRPSARSSTGGSWPALASANSPLRSIDQRRTAPSRTCRCRCLRPVAVRPRAAPAPAMPPSPRGDFQHGHRPRHEQRRRHALVGHVADGEPQHVARRARRSCRSRRRPPWPAPATRAPAGAGRRREACGAGGSIACWMSRAIYSSLSSFCRAAPMSLDLRHLPLDRTARAVEGACHHPDFVAALGVRAADSRTRRRRNGWPTRSAPAAAA